MEKYTKEGLLKKSTTELDAIAIEIGLVDHNGKPLLRGSKKNKIETILFTIKFENDYRILTRQR